MTYRRIGAFKTADDFRAHVAAVGITLPFDETRLQPPQASGYASQPAISASTWPRLGWSAGVTRSCGPICL